MRPAERILRYPNLASYLEENLPTKKILLSMSLAKHLKPEGNIWLQHYFIGNIYSKMHYYIGVSKKNLNTI